MKKTTVFASEPKCCYCTGKVKKGDQLKKHLNNHNLKTDSDLMSPKFYHFKSTLEKHACIFKEKH